jgi:hypothetical protein
MSSDIDIDSDYMMLDETFDDMGDIVINIHDNQKTMLENLTVRNITVKTFIIFRLPKPVIFYFFK